MVASIQSPADIVNLALVRIGYPKRVGSLFDGSKAASPALDVYGQTRDALMRDGDWGFCEGNIVGNLLKAAPDNYVPPNVWDPALYPPQPWRYSYEYPGDCLRVRNVNSSVITLPNDDPQPTLWQIANDSTYTPPQRVILANVQFALIVYSRQVTNPAIWPPDFIEALAGALARRLAAALKDMQTAQMEATDEQASKLLAAMEEG